LPVARAAVTATILLPAYNEEDALPSVLADLAAVAQDDWEILVVDDGSTDRTAEIASRHPCRLLRHATNLGKGAAMQTGFAYARGDRVVVMDADATYPASALPRILAVFASAGRPTCRP
jgi:glycosyltransferase involved in cell wall biosynthesis